MLAELLLERYGIVTREQVLAEGVPGGFAMLYDTLSKLETLGICRRGYFIEGLGGAQFALPGAVERLRAAEPDRRSRRRPPLVLAAADPAQPYGAALPWPKREGQERRPARVAGAYLVSVADRPVLYVERGRAGPGARSWTRASRSDRRVRQQAGQTSWERRSWRSPRPSEEVAWASSRSSGSTVSRRSPRRSLERSSISASSRVRGDSR